MASDVSVGMIGQSSSVVKQIDRNVVFYEDDPNMNNPIVDDKFFDYTMADLKFRQKDLANQVLSERNRPFISQTYLEQLNRERKLQCYKHCVVRFSFGSTLKLQAAFGSSEPVLQLFDLLSNILKEDSSNIQLHFIGKKLQRSSTASLLDEEIAPVGKIVVCLKESSTMEKWVSRIKENVKGVTADEANQISQDWLSVNTAYKPYEEALIAMESRLDSVNLKRSTEQVPENGTEVGNMPFTAFHTPRAEFPKWFKSNK